MGKQPCGFPDMTKWEQDHKGNIEYCCPFCGIYTASEPRCNECQGEREENPPFTMIYKNVEMPPYYPEHPVNNSVFPNHGRGKK